DKKSFGATDVAEPVRLLVLDHIADELRAALAEPGKRLLDAVHSAHDAKVAESIHRRVPGIGDDGRVEESRKRHPTVDRRPGPLRLWPSGVTSMAISTRWDPSPVTRPAHSPTTMARPSSLRPSSEKNEIAASRDSTTMPTLSIRLRVISSALTFGRERPAL